MEDALLQRITLNPDVCFGKPTIRSLRYPVEMILDLLGAGMSFADILADYPDLEREDLQACLLFAGKLVKVNSIHKVIAALGAIDLSEPREPQTLPLFHSRL